MQQFAEFASNHLMLMMALTVIIALIVNNEMSRAFRGFKDLVPMDATRVINHDDALVLDVRENAEVEGGRIPDAVHIPLTALKDRMGELDKHKGRPVIVYCRSGSRSARACGQLRKQGFETVYNLGGGIMAWQSENLPLNKK